MASIPNQLQSKNILRLNPDFVHETIQGKLPSVFAYQPQRFNELVEHFILKWS